MKLTSPGLPRDGAIELKGDCVQVADPQVDEAVGPGVASVLR
jgi:hypothetical protein